jgi:hypothetical protein
MASCSRPRSENRGSSYWVHPPASRASRQPHQLVCLRLIGDSVEKAEVPDIAQAGPPGTRLQTAYLRGRTQQPLGHTFDGEAEPVAQLAQPPAELTLAVNRVRDLGAIK